MLMLEDTTVSVGTTSPVIGTWADIEGANDQEARQIQLRGWNTLHGPRITEL